MLVRARCAQELGHLGDNGSLPALWRLAEHGEAEIERLAATESLLRIKTFGKQEQEALTRCLANETHPYVLKNLLLMLPHADLGNWRAIAEIAVKRCPHQIVVDSFCWANSHPSGDVFTQPDVEPPYSSKTRYPDLEFYPLYFEVSGGVGLSGLG
jgi:hypothetical protein